MIPTVVVPCARCELVMDFEANAPFAGYCSTCRSCACPVQGVWCYIGERRRRAGDGPWGLKILGEAYTTLVAAEWAYHHSILVAEGATL